MLSCFGALLLMKMIDKKTFLIQLFNRFGDFNVTALYMKNNRTYCLFKRWFLFSDIMSSKVVMEAINNRTILDVEVVLDLDDKHRYADLIKNLNDDSLNYYAFSSGNKSYHIHLFFPELQQFSSEDRKLIRYQIIKKYGCDFSKASERCMITIEFSAHFRTNRQKQLLLFKKGFNRLPLNIMKDIKLSELKR